ncbi:uncharacterized protein PHALS_05449 [Plasmopara halstedii]|uniref:Uncharacterized protein n=1 Tax=Plasmopara halstedii TaxID=4781 RepID=A0A0P1B3B5_PLAHL|nr:uncharacterized protein PHALS_05449 [Plasmopara halstedii]CEG47965.1 hypothetical protein PHALS_05449 [Plasmopara halstedii]|eukprot:XP_024584334.1 hypothetical protein PHALS_05449 [Plasmopara halstedii]
MEEFFQYIGPDGGALSSSTLLNRERMFVYVSPHETPIDKCGELRVGSYFACSGILYYENQVWLKIRRGYFSNAKNNGYIRVYFEHPTGLKTLENTEIPSRQLSSVVAVQPAQFRYIRRLPKFPTYMCARDQLVLYREPVFKLHSASVSSAGASLQSMHRFLPPVSIFQATECKFNQDFTQLAVKVTSTLAGLKGWINVSYHKTLIEVEDPKRYGVFRHGPIYLQNVANRSGKWVGELPVRAIPSLKAPRLYSVESYRVVRAIERKLLKDRIWIRIQPFKVQEHSQMYQEKKSDEPDPAINPAGNQENENEKNGTRPDAWVIERNANTAQRVLVPWGSNRIEDIPMQDTAERYYRNVYSRRPLPLRRTTDLEAEVVGHLEPGQVFSSTRRILNDSGRMWIRVALPTADKLRDHGDNAGKDDEDNNAMSHSPNNNIEDLKEDEYELKHLSHTVQYGYVLQSNAKINTCMVQEIPCPGKLKSKEYYQVNLSLDHGNQEVEAEGISVPANTITARADASDCAKELFYIKNSAIVSAISSVYNAKEKRMWLQVLATELDPAMCVKHQWPLTEAEQKLNIVYLPMCCSKPNACESVLKPLHCDLTRIENPFKVEKDSKQSSARVVFSGRASKLFGSHLLHPSTIHLAPFQNTKEPHSATNENNRAQTLKDEITAWQRERSNPMTQLYMRMGSLVSYSFNCIRQPFASCLAHQDSKQRYRQLDQEEEGMEDYVLDDD